PICIFVDFLGVETQEEVASRLRRAVERALSRTFPTRHLLKSLLDVAGSLRPTIETDSLTGAISVSIAPHQSSSKSDLTELIEKLGELHKTNKVFLAFDEFQDISSIKGLAAVMRGALQNLPKNLPVFICGSKKHLLSAMFGPHRAPFSGWGSDLEIPTISNQHYRDRYFEYARDRLKGAGISIDPKAFDLLLSKCDGVPESVNIVLGHIARKASQVIVDPELMGAAIASVIDERRGRFEEQLIRFRGSSRQILINIAKYGPIKQPKGKDFLALARKLSPSTVFNVVRQLEQNADIYVKPDGYVVADPLFATYLVRYH
ncbi:MAG: hypothetical protein RL011_363, partial [Pseudomonadota bacterium]